MPRQFRIRTKNGHSYSIHYKLYKHNLFLVHYQAAATAAAMAKKYGADITVVGMSPMLCTIGSFKS